MAAIQTIAPADRRSGPGDRARVAHLHDPSARTSSVTDLGHATQDERLIGGLLVQLTAFSRRVMG